MELLCITASSTEVLLGLTVDSKFVKCIDLLCKKASNNICDLSRLPC